MFSVIYKFQVKESLTQQFEENWAELTKLISQHQGGLGSRLHKSDKLTYIAYAQWPDNQTWESEWNDMPEHAKEVSRKMKEACETSETIFELEVVEDLLER